MLRATSTATLFLLLAACGGGGGTDSDPLARRVAPDVAYDTLNRVTFNAAATPVPCPTENVEAWFVAGQSNAAGHAQPPAGDAPGRVFQFHQGRCYTLASPLLGAGAWPDDSRNYNPFQHLAQTYSAATGKVVVLKLYSIGGTSIKAWDTNLLPMEAAELLSLYPISRFLWQQGETDNFEGMGTTEYVQRFESLLMRVGADRAHVAQSSICAGSSEVNAISAAHQELQKKYPGPNTDPIATSTYRYDECHFNPQGVLEFTRRWMQTLAKEA